jgi:hypothetical protein
MNRKISLSAVSFCTVLAVAVSLPRTNADAADEIKRLAAVMERTPASASANNQLLDS